MTTQVIEETPAPQADPETPQVETEEPTTEPVAEPAAPEAEPAAAPQVEVTEPEKPEYMTKADWEREKAEVASRAAADALEADRRKRQTENARKAAQEKRDKELHDEAVDVARATFAAELGVSPASIPDDLIDKAISRVARRQAESISASALDGLDNAWDYVAAPAHGTTVELDPDAQGLAKRLLPKMQGFVDAVTDKITAKAREGYIAESELPRLKQQWAEERAANGRKGQEELKRVEGTPAMNTNTLEAWETRIAHQGEEGYPHLTDAEWGTYRQIRRVNGL